MFVQQFLKDSARAQQYEQCADDAGDEYCPEMLRNEVVGDHQSDTEGDEKEPHRPQKKT